MIRADSIFRFGPCELDEARRSLAVRGRELKLEPRVFDLLCYLVRHRDRVVPKDELLEALWPRTVVVDNALQRVVSLARSALAESGVADAVRTYPRHGYRFVLGDATASQAPPASQVAPEDRLAAAHAACARCDWADACGAFAAADAQMPLAAHDIEVWARAAICAGVGPNVVTVLERLAVERGKAADAVGAARATLLLVQIRIDQRQTALARGLLQRAARELDGLGDTAERGHHAWMCARMALPAGDVEAALGHAAQACRIGRAVGDADVECLGLTYLGHALMTGGDMARGLTQHDEAAAMVRVGGVSA